MRGIGSRSYRHRVAALPELFRTLQIRKLRKSTCDMTQPLQLVGFPSRDPNWGTGLPTHRSLMPKRNHLALPDHVEFLVGAQARKSRAPSPLFPRLLRRDGVSRRLALPFRLTGQRPLATHPSPDKHLGVGFGVMWWLGAGCRHSAGAIAVVA